MERRIHRVSISPRKQDWCWVERWGCQRMLDNHRRDPSWRPLRHQDLILTWLQILNIWFHRYSDKTPSSLLDSGHVCDNIDRWKVSFDVYSRYNLSNYLTIRIYFDFKIVSIKSLFTVRSVYSYLTSCSCHSVIAAFWMANSFLFNLMLV